MLPDKSLGRIIPVGLPGFTWERQLWRLDSASALLWAHHHRHHPYPLSIYWLRQPQLGDHIWEEKAFLDICLQFASTTTTQHSNIKPFLFCLGKTNQISFTNCRMKPWQQVGLFSSHSTSGKYSCKVVGFLAHLHTIEVPDQNIFKWTILRRWCQHNIGMATSHLQRHPMVEIEWSKQNCRVLTVSKFWENSAHSYCWKMLEVYKCWTPQVLLI